MANVVSVNISEKKGQMKHEVPSIELKIKHGIVGDAHAGDWHRQVSMLAEESVDKMRVILPTLVHGAFAENINTRGIELMTQPIGTRMKIGESAVVEVTQIGKECHNDCAIKQAVGKCVMPTEGIFVIVIEEGTVKAGDEIVILED
ncbi:MAG: MOSC domain-containing protein [Firmicutes bacterium]|nr:MOSC domain-containing protein [Bacillota bacterium]